MAVINRRDKDMDTITLTDARETLTHYYNAARTANRPILVVDGSRGTIGTVRYALAVLRGVDQYGPEFGVDDEEFVTACEELDAITLHLNTLADQYAPGFIFAYVDGDLFFASEKWVDQA